MGAPDLRRRLGRAIRARRLKLGVSQESLALDAGVSPTYLGQVERGLRSPSLDVINSISAALGCPLWELLREVA